MTHNELGRIEKRKEEFKAAIELFEVAIYENQRYIAPYREMVGRYMYMGETGEAKKKLGQAKRIDSGNIFLALLEAQLLQREGEVEKSIKLLDSFPLSGQAHEQILFRKGRALALLDNVSVEYRDTAPSR